MDDLTPEPDRFLVYPPCYVLLSRATRKRRGFEAAVIFLGTPEHGRLLPLFTDADLAERARAGVAGGGSAADQAAMAGAAAETVGDACTLYRLMCYAEAQGAKYVGIDVEPRPADRGGFQGQFVPIRAAIAGLPPGTAG